MSGGDEPPHREDEGVLVDGLQGRLLKELSKFINAKRKAIVPQIKNKPVTPAKKRKRKPPYPAPQKSWNDSKNSVTGNLVKREVTTRIKRLKMAKPQSRAKAKARSTKKKKTITKRRSRRQRGGGFDIQKWISKLCIEFHWPGYQPMGPGTKLAKRVKRGDPGINRLDKLPKQHDIDYTNAKSLSNKHTADRKMVAGINNFKGKKSWTEEIVKRVM